MADEHDNSGALFRNMRKEKDSHADYGGEVRVDGISYYLDAWINESKSGTKYMRLRFKRKEGTQ